MTLNLSMLILFLFNFIFFVFAPFLISRQKAQIVTASYLCLGNDYLILRATVQNRTASAQIFPILSSRAWPTFNATSLVLRRGVTENIGVHFDSIQLCPSAVPFVNARCKQLDSCGNISVYMQSESVIVTFVAYRSTELLVDLYVDERRISGNSLSISVVDSDVTVFLSLLDEVINPSEAIRVKFEGQGLRFNI